MTFGGISAVVSLDPAMTIGNSTAGLDDLEAVYGMLMRYDPTSKRRTTVQQAERLPGCSPDALIHASVATFPPDLKLLPEKLALLTMIQGMDDHFTTPESRSFARSSWPYPNSSRMASVCSPSPQGAPSRLGAFENRTRGGSRQ